MARIAGGSLSGAARLTVHDRLSGAGPGRVAVIELGSNSFHLLVVACRPDGSWDTVAHHREHLPLADTVLATGRIGPELGRQVVRTVAEMRRQAEAHEVATISARATHAFRHAEDAAPLLDRLRESAGVEVEVITGEQEAEFVFGAVAASMDLPPGALVADLGGGSLELAWSDRRDSRWTASLPLGAAVLAGGTEAGRHSQYESVPLMVRRVLAALRDEGSAPSEILAVVGCGGTLAAVGRGLRQWRGEPVPAPGSLNQVRLPRVELEAFAAEADRMSGPQRQRRFGLSSRRAALLPAGTAVALACLRWAGVHELMLSDWGLREGLVIAALGRSPSPLLPRESAIHALRIRYSVDERHAAQVAWLASELFDRTVLLHHLDPSDRELLCYGAILADIGRTVGPDGYERHTAYLIEHAGLRGFAPDEIGVLSCLGRYHRGGRPKPDFAAFAALPPRGQAAVTSLVALLQIAVAMERPRSASIEALEVHLKPGRAVLVMSTEDGVGPDLSAVERAARLFERTFGRLLELRCDDVSPEQLEVPA